MHNHLVETFSKLHRMMKRTGQSLISPGYNSPELQRESEKAVSPIVRGFIFGIGIFYTLTAAVYLKTQSGPALMYFGVLAFGTLLCCGWLYFDHVRQPASITRLEWSTALVSLLIYSNVLVYMILDFHAFNTVYFVLMGLVFAVSAPTLRLMIVSPLICFATVLALLNAFEPKLVSSFLWMLIAAVFTAIGMASTLRLTLNQSVAATIASERHKLAAQALALRDPLTNMPNRRSFFRVFEERIANLIEKNARFDLILIDLDGFKPINDIYGHATGDALLIEVAHRLKTICEHRYFAARLGGDEFGILSRQSLSDDDLRNFATRVIDALRQPYEINGIICNISASIGLTHAYDKSVNSRRLMEQADYVLYYAKQNQRGTPVLFDDNYRQEMYSFGIVDHTLRHADLNRELYILFQPQYDMERHKTIGFEALARWRSPELGLVSPDVFIKAAERSGIISHVTLVLLAKTLTILKSWPDDIKVSFNLSVRDLRSKSAMKRIINMVLDSGIDPSRIEFEITETVMMTDFDQARQTLLALKKIGVGIALDDFGSGYSSLGYIHELPVDKIKVDRSFVLQLGKHDHALKVIKTIIDLCRNLNLTHVIEGVESLSEYEAIRSVKGRVIQGYFIARPMPADEVDTYLRTEVLERNGGDYLTQKLA